MRFKDLGNYIVYDDGRVFGKKRGKFLTPVMGKGKDCYYHVKIPKRIKIHRLVALAFVPNPHNKPQINHKDGDKTNNNSYNLEWVTQMENMKHSYSNGLHNNSGENSGRAKLSAIDVRIIRDCINERRFTNVEIAGYFKIDPSTICDIKSGKSWSSL